MFSRSILAVTLLAAAAVAAPPLTTVRDTLYKADGTRFTGIVTITWSSFQSSDNSTIVQQSTTIKVVDGNLRVQLVPTTTSTPAIYYTVVYNSDGRTQFKETWSVPPSTDPLRVQDVRIASTTGNDTAPSGTTTPINESDVVGLMDDLEARPVKGAGYAPGRVAVVNAAGLLEAASGTASDCVRVDGSSGPCGSAASFVDGDSPAGLVDGANAVFTLLATPYPAASLSVYRNGLLQKVGQDYSLSGNTIQFVDAAIPQPGDTLLAAYRLSGDNSSPSEPFPTTQVLCSGTGGSATATNMTSIGTCAIPAGILQAGDRVELRYDVEHEGGASGFSFEIHWGGTVLGHRDADASETLVTVRADAGITAAGAQLSFQSLGTVLPFAAGVAASTDSYASGLTVDFQGALQQSGDTLQLRSFSVVRVP